MILSENEVRKFKYLWDTEPKTKNVAIKMGRKTGSWACKIASELGLPMRTERAKAMTKKEEATFRAMWQRGDRTIDISRHFGRKSMMWSSKKARQLGLEARCNREFRFSDDERSTFIKMWERGDKTQDIADKFGRKNDSWASRMAVRLSLPQRNSRPVCTDETIYRIIELRSKGWNIKQISDKLIVCKDVVRDLLIAAGMPAHKKLEDVEA